MKTQNDAPNIGACAPGAAECDQSFTPLAAAAVLLDAGRPEPPPAVWTPAPPLTSPQPPPTPPEPVTGQPGAGDAGRALRPLDPARRPPSWAPAMPERPATVAATLVDGGLALNCLDDGLECVQLRAPRSVPLAALRDAHDAHAQALAALRTVYEATDGAP